MRSVTLKSAITPSFMGRMATMLPGVRPSMSLASLPTASTSPLFLLMATMEGSFTTMPLPLAKTKVLAVPKSIARSDENKLNSERTFMAHSRRAPSALPVYRTNIYRHFKDIAGGLTANQSNITTPGHQFLFIGLLLRLDLWHTPGACHVPTLGDVMSLIS